MRRSKKKRLLIFVPASLAFIAIILMVVWLCHGKFEALRGNISQLTTMLDNYEKQQITVLCATRDIAQGEVVTAQDFEYVQIMSLQFPADIVTVMPQSKASYSRIDISKGTYLVSGMLCDEIADASLRELMFEAIEVDPEISCGNSIDVRICYADGTDYVVLSDKHIYGLDEDKQRIWLRLSEEEILLMDSAMVDSRTFKDTRIYAALYVEPELQAAAITNYYPSAQSAKLISEDPNIAAFSSDFLSSSKRREIEAKLEDYLNESK